MLVFCVLEVLNFQRVLDAHFGYVIVMLQPTALVQFKEIWIQTSDLKNMLKKSEKLYRFLTKFCLIDGLS